MLSLLLAASVATAQPLCPGDETLIGKRGIPTHATYCNDGMPPVRFQNQDSFVAIQFKRPIQVHMSCGDGRPPTNYVILACTDLSVVGSFVLTMPNPCEYANEPGEHYAALLCHELGHVAGWPAYHGD